MPSKSFSLVATAAILVVMGLGLSGSDSTFAADVIEHGDPVTLHREETQTVVVSGDDVYVVMWAKQQPVFEPLTYMPEALVTFDKASGTLQLSELTAAGQATTEWVADGKRVAGVARYNLAGLGADATERLMDGLAESNCGFSGQNACDSGGVGAVSCGIVGCAESPNTPLECDVTCGAGYYACCGCRSTTRPYQNPFLGGTTVQFTMAKCQCCEAAGGRPR